MPTILSKFIDKAKPRFSFNHHQHPKSGSTDSTNSKNSAHEEKQHHKFRLSTSLPTASLSSHTFGYKDNTKDSYVEPPPIPPTQTEPIKENHPAFVHTPTHSTPSSPSSVSKVPLYPDEYPHTPPTTPGGSVFVSNNTMTTTPQQQQKATMADQNDEKEDSAKMVATVPASPPREEEEEEEIDEQVNESKSTTTTSTDNTTDDRQSIHTTTENSVATNSTHNTRLQVDDSDVTRPHCQLKLANFNLQRTLGTGSFGRVHLVQSKLNKRYYALKVLKKSEIVKLKQVEHTNNERAILIRVQHPFIVNLWGSFQDCANLYMVMDFVPGGELFSILRKSKKFSNDVARFYAGEVLLALAYLHSKNIIYRDLKPENILLDAHGHVRITDFGFAKLVPDITWTLCGTPDYLAPEIIQTKGYGKAADYWAFGVLLFEMLAGHPPYYDDNQFKLYEKILTTQPKYPASIDATAQDLLKHLLTQDLTQRYGNLKRGYLDICEHKWFASLDFEALIQRKIKPPHIPHLKSEGDPSNFDKYPEEVYMYGIQQEDPYHDQFPDF